MNGVPLEWCPLPKFIGAMEPKAVHDWKAACAVNVSLDERPRLATRPPQPPRAFPRGQAPFTGGPPIVPPEVALPNADRPPLHTDSIVPSNHFDRLAGKLRPGICNLVSLDRRTWRDPLMWAIARHFRR